MMRQLVMASLLIGLCATFSQPASASPATVAVNLSNFKFSPNIMHLKAGVPVVLRLANNASGGHNFSAPQFFAAARLDAASAARLGKGTIEVPKHGSVSITLVPVAGRYPLKCTHTLHSAFGMKGTIIVD
ncbi:MAG: cupredoxin domain-containing protein [Sphingomicrobium sp.]